jgi:hypothetical protein
LKHWDVLDEDISIAGLLAGHGHVTRSKGRALPRRNKVAPRRARRRLRDIRLSRLACKCYMLNMTTAEDIEKAVAQLSSRELARFRAWFEAFDAEQFDAAIARDAQSGKLDALADEALAAQGARANISRRRKNVPALIAASAPLRMVALRAKERSKPRSQNSAIDPADSSVGSPSRASQ